MTNVKPLRLRRPVRSPGQEEARHRLALDLSIKRNDATGYDWDKVQLLQDLPLFDVAIEGHLFVFAVTGRRDGRRANPEPAQRARMVA